MISKFIKKNKKGFLYFIIVSIFSFLNTLSKGLVNGCDFQWQPAVLFWEGVNHYQKFIINGKGDFYVKMVNTLTYFMFCTTRLLCLNRNSKDIVAWSKCYFYFYYSNFNL